MAETPCAYANERQQVVATVEMSSLTAWAMPWVDGKEMFQAFDGIVAGYPFGPVESGQRADGKMYELKW